VTTKEQARVEEILKRYETVALEEISEILRSQSLKDEIKEGGIECYEVSISDIGEDGYIRQPKKSLQLSEKGFKKTRPLVLKPHDIILAVKGSVGKVGLVPPFLNDTWIANQSFQVIRIQPNPKLNDPTILFRYLCSPVGQSLLQARISGTTVPMVQTRDVKSLPIAVPSQEEQKLISEDHRTIVEIYEEIASLREQADKISTRHWAM
jgi:type I restriction enzyme M protein